MNPSNGLVTALNKMREMSVSEGSIYHQYVPVITDLTSIGEFGTPILEYTDVRNEFMTKLVKRIVETQIEGKVFNNKLSQLEGEQVPLGYSIQDIYVNPAKGRKFNVEDFAGLLQKYEADVKQQFLTVNMDMQYPVTITRAKLKNAFTSWGALESFITGITNSLYSGANIDQYNFTKYLVSNAFRNGHTINKVVTAPTTEATSKAFVKAARALALDFAEASSDFNAWAKVNTDDSKALVTWTEPEDIVFVLRNDVIAELDVDVLASAFNIGKAELMGRIIGVRNFDMYSDAGTKVFDGSSILGIMCDRKWFKIKSQDLELDSFYNANNRTWQYYYNVVKMYNYSLFANAVVFCTAEPDTSS
jgi:hypothetical protein